VIGISDYRQHSQRFALTPENVLFLFSSRLMVKPSTACALAGRNSRFSNQMDGPQIAAQEQSDAIKWRARRREEPTWRASALAFGALLVHI
jgi:hypothetical protein